MIEKRTPLFFLLAIAVFISGCSGSDEANNKVASVNVTASPGEVIANGTHTVTVMASVKDDQGEPVNGATVSFTSTRGTFSSSTSATSATTDSNGIASANLSSTSVGEAEVSAIAGAFSSSSSIMFIQDANDQVASLSLNASPNEINAQSASTVLLTALIEDASGNPLANVVINFSTDFGSLTASSRSTNENGIATVGLNSDTVGTATINVSAGGFNTSETVKFIEDVSDQVAEINLGFNVDQTIASESNKISVTATALDSEGNPVTGAPIQFNTSLGKLTQNEKLTSSDGTASVEISSTQSGQADITASVGAISITKTVSFTIGENQVDKLVEILSLSTSNVSIASNNAEQAKITATVLDKYRAVLPGAFVRFEIVGTDGGQPNGGQLSLSSTLSDENGEATVFFSSGASDPSNRTITISATSNGMTKTIPVQVTGSTVTIESDANSLILGSDNASDASESLSIIAKNSNGTPVYDTDISVTVSNSSTGSATLSSPSSGKTDVNGRFNTTLTAVSAGTITVTATALNASNSKTFTINQIEQAFQITAPTAERTDSDVNSTLTIAVKAPNSNKVTFITSLGTLSGASGSGNKITEDVSGGTVSATLTSTVGGAATVEVFDSSNNSIMDRLIVDFSAPAIEAKYITIQADRNVVPLKVGDINYEAKITAQVFNQDDFPVRNATVWFTIENATGGGEFLSPVYGTTRPDGSFETTFNSGTISSTPQGVIIKARVVNNGTEFTDDIPIVIGGTAGSVVVGRSTTLSSMGENTAYSMPMSVLVADSNGNPIAGTTVSLSTWPNGYYKGYWDPVYGVSGDIIRCIARTTSAKIANEDINKNLIMDVGEDVNNDGTLTPENSAAGTLPQVLTTDENGLATFNLVYLKHYSTWVESQIRVSTMVQGTETTSVLNFRLSSLESDIKACALPDSPFGNETLTVVASDRTLLINGSTTVIASGGTAPYNYSVDDQSVATINPQTGELTAIAQGSVTVIASDINNIIGYSSVIFISDDF